MRIPYGGHKWTVTKGRGMRPQAYIVKCGDRTIAAQMDESDARLIAAAPRLQYFLQDTLLYIVEHAQRCTDASCAHHATLRDADEAERASH